MVMNKHSYLSTQLDDLNNIKMYTVDKQYKNRRHTIHNVFSHKPLVSCLRPSMCSYDGELYNLDFSVHVLFPSYRDSDLYLPLYD